MRWSLHFASRHIRSPCDTEGVVDTLTMAWSDDNDTIFYVMIFYV